MDQLDSSAVCRRIYAETNEVYDRFKRELGANDRGFKILYGPPHRDAPILFIGDQPGGAIADEKDGERFGWPSVCEYATESWLLARNLRAMFGSEFLRNCVGINANFFRAPNADAWQTAPVSVRNALERFSHTKLLEIIHIINPTQIVVIGLKTLDMFGPSNPVLLNANNRVLMKSGQIGQWAAISTLHLSGAQIAGDDRRAIAEFILKGMTGGSGSEIKSKPNMDIRKLCRTTANSRIADNRGRKTMVVAAVEDVGPAQTLLVLKKLQGLGISNESFRRLHQSGKTIRSVEAYCETAVKSFNRDDNNERLHRRLEYVLKHYVALGVPLGSADVFAKLAEISLTKIPPRPTGR